MIGTLAYFALRIIGKIIGSWLSSSGTSLRSDLFRGSMAQGPLAIAMALSMRIMFEGEFIEISYDVALIVIALNELLSARMLWGLLVDAGGEIREDLNLQRRPNGWRQRTSGRLCAQRHHCPALAGLCGLQPPVCDLRGRPWTPEVFALGFVILASYIIGELVGSLIAFPHITGYLLGGLFGPSLGETLHKVFPDLHLIPPFDHGILNADIIRVLWLVSTHSPCRSSASQRAVPCSPRRFGNPSFPSRAC